jgi:alanyl-tRNA synthetase
MPLRKEPSRDGELRLIEIEGFDLTPCGGTHAYRTGEVGMIAMRSWERAKGLTRVEFVAGTRALGDYRRANKSAREVAALFSCGRDDVAQHAAQLVEENKELRRAVRASEEVAAGVEAERLWSAAAARADGTRIVSHVFGADAAERSVRDSEFLKRVAHALIAHPQTIALLGSRENDAARVVFARSPDAPGDMNALMREACAMLDGRGGGKPDMAQGGGKNVAKLEEAIRRVAQLLAGS